MGAEKNVINEELMRFLETEELQGIFNEYGDGSEMAESAGFNVFTMTSDVFYRENYHSDILKAFLDPKELHGEGSKFLEVFIDMLNSAKRRNHKPLGTGDSSKPIDKKKYSDASVLREPERIDILIKGDGHSIIIENKINDARDMDRQLPRYYDLMTKAENGNAKYEVDAVVYLTKCPSYPSDKDWTDDDKKNIYPRLINISIDGGKCWENALIQSWISPSIDMSSNLDCLLILRQYSKLLKTLIPPAKNEKVMNDFLKYLLDESQRFGQAVEISEKLPEMLRELPSQMAQSLQKDVNSHYASKFGWGHFLSWPVWRSAPMECVVSLPKEYSIFVICKAEKEDAYTVCLKNFAGNILKEEDFKGIQDMSQDQNQKCFYKTFGFYDKEKVIDFIGYLLDKTKRKFLK